jgi:ribosomal protein S27E
MKNKNKRMSFQTEIVKGECPTCNQITTLVGITSQFYRCMECGGDLEQHVNGKISYLPIMSKRDDGGVEILLYLKNKPNGNLQKILKSR